MLLGCRSGAACPFRHEVLDTAKQSTAPTAAVQDKSARRHQTSTPLQHAVGTETVPIVPQASTTGAVNTSRITHRPIPQAQLADPRAYQVAQLRRRFTPNEYNENSSTILTFRLRPSDPDFPFELDALHCTLRVPLDYPEGGGKPTIRVTNPGMERGYQVNIEQGFDKIVAASASSTLLSHLNSLDKQLESLLSLPKTDTVKIVSHFKKLQKIEATPHSIAENRAEALVLPPVLPSIRLEVVPKVTVYSPEQRTQAKQARDASIRQLEARMGKLPQFSKSSNGSIFTIPIDPRKRGDLPVELQSIKLVKLVVPEDFNLSPCSITLVGVTGDAVQAVEEAFHTRVMQVPAISLLNHINYLTQNMHVMAKPKAKPKTAVGTVDKATQYTPSQELLPTPPSTTSSTVSSTVPPADVIARSHIITIPRPPEWDIHNKDETESSDESSDDENDPESAEENTGDEQNTYSSNRETSSPERGLRVSFPHLALFGIELLEIVTLNITVKCERCKDSKEITNIQDTSRGIQARAESCKKCAAPFAIGTPYGHIRIVTAC
jgi:hypothetical protein